LRASVQQAEEIREASNESREMQARYELEMRLVKQKAALQAAKQQLVFVELERQHHKLESRFEDVSAENQDRIVRPLSSFRNVVAIDC
jgi:uncharacterized protein YcaQ